MNTSKLQEIKLRYTIVGNCDALNRALDIALQVAPTDLSVLITGESGVGKEAIPRIIHDNSIRKHEKYFAINCGSIPEGTIDSELFGHEKGSFTGAVGESEGYFGSANKGTLFLDEVGELPLATQARLLRVLETGEYIRVGATNIRKTDVRIVAATNLNLQKAISEGRFREDLYYRLNTIPIKMPSLRERGTDVVLLFRLFAMQIAQKLRMDKIVLSEDAEKMLLRYKWPGNVRQLKNVTEQMSVMAQDRLITPDILRQFVPEDEDSFSLVAIPREKHSYENEREMLYKMLFEMKNTINDINRKVHGMEEQLDIIKESAGQGLSVTPRQFTAINSPVSVANYAEEAEVEENLNIESKEAEMISRALQRNEGNREQAATELGISNRTLYRKIKKSGLQKK
ncbi:MAG: sigma-54 dependent transcriptional regulator [Prevotellaceae bacterium]|nr:sigma-54 dependent transcriptional regulator [Prevotellaceae bacterium]